VTSLVKDAAEGAISAAERIGTAAAHAVRATVNEATGGVKNLARRGPVPAKRRPARRPGARASRSRPAQRKSA